MKKYSKIIFKYLGLAVAGLFFVACEKEHLQPDIPESQAVPLVYISAMLGPDSVYFTAGVNSYVGLSWVADTGVSRYFCFYLYSELSAPLQPKRCFKIYVNNATLTAGVPEHDLDSTIVTDSLNYETYGSGFTPSAVTVEWYDSTGAQFSSTIWPQSQYNFVITSVEDVTYDNHTYK